MLDQDRFAKRLVPVQFETPPVYGITTEASKFMVKIVTDYFAEYKDATPEEKLMELESCYQQFGALTIYIGLLEWANNMQFDNPIIRSVPGIENDKHLATHVRGQFDPAHVYKALPINPQNLEVFLGKYFSPTRNIASCVVLDIQPDLITLKGFKGSSETNWYLEKLPKDFISIGDDKFTFIPTFGPNLFTIRLEGDYNKRWLTLSNNLNIKSQESNGQNIFGPNITIHEGQDKKLVTGKNRKDWLHFLGLLNEPNCPNVYEV